MTCFFRSSIVRKTTSYLAALNPAWVLLFLLLGLSAMPATAQTTFIVNVTGNGADTNPGNGVCRTGAGNCSLRAAIEEANALAGADSIHFNISGTAPHVITPSSAFPNITEAVVIDGSTQPGNAGVCTTTIPDRPAYGIVLDGTNAGTDVDGLEIESGSDGSVIRGLNIRNFDGNGIYEFSGQNSWVQCSRIVGNRRHGINMRQGSSGTVVGTDGDGVNDAFEGNLISDNGGPGVSPRRENVVAGNFIGTNSSGTSAWPNGGHGILFSSRNIRVGTNGDGVSDALEGNLISGNTGNGVQMHNGAMGNVVAGNRIGTDITGTLPLGNGSHGLAIASADDNRIGTNGDGVNDEAESNIIAFNAQDGVSIGRNNDDNNAVLGNAIFGNGGLGIDLFGTTTNDTDDDDETANRGQNWPEMASAHLTSSVLTLTYRVDTAPTNATYPLRVEVFLADADSSEGQTFLGALVYDQADAQQQVMAPLTPAVAVSLGDVLVTTATDADGNTSEFSAPVTVVRPNLIVNATGDGADTSPGDGFCQTASGDCSLRAAIEEANALAGADSIHFNIPGSGPHVITPTSALPRITKSVILDGSTQPGNESVCTTAIPDRPIYQVVLDGTDAGTDVDGLGLDAGPDNSVIRGLNIRNFDRNGIFLRSSQGSLVQCSFIGTDETGMAAAGNGHFGVELSSATENSLVGTDGDGVDDAFEGNLLSGNNQGIVTFEQTVVAGNFIGTDKSGTAALPNATRGMLIQDPNVLVGTNSDGVSDALEGNLVSGNTQDGVIIGGSITGIVVAGNRIGTDLTGTLPLGNGSHGVRLQNNPQGNRIGTDGDGANDAAEANIIAFNTQDGVSIEGNSAEDNAVLGNAIFSNGEFGIDLFGTTANDTEDPDETANRGQNWPEIASVFPSGGDLLVTYLVDTAPTNATYPLRVEVFLADADSTEGQTFLGAVDYAQADAQQQVTASFTPAVAVSLGDVLVGTATDADGNTSEFSAPVTVTLPTFTVDSTGDETDASPGDGTCQTASGDCTLRAAIEEANTSVGADSIRFDIAGSGPHLIAPASALPEITRPVFIDGSTQPGNEAVCTTAIPDRPTYGIVLDGTNAGIDAHGLRLRGANRSFIRGLNIRNFDGSGIYGRGSQEILVQCSFIGTNETGMVAAGNGVNGIQMNTGTENSIVGTDGDGVNDAFEGNLISGNDNRGVTVDAGSVVAGNFIGTDKSGTGAVPNALSGIGISTNILVGTNGDGVSDALEGNLISGNTQHGVNFDGSITGVVVAGNRIGTDLTGTLPLGNGRHGIRFKLDPQGNRIGTNGDGVNDAAEANIIAFNTQDGVSIESNEADNNAVLGNAIFSNGDLGIDLFGTTTNDTDDADETANRGQNWPELAAAFLPGGNLTVSYLVDTAPTNATYPLRVEVFLADADSTEGQTFLGAVVYTQADAQQQVTASFTPAVAVSLGDVLVATATDADGNTSEFSASVTVTATPPFFTVNVTSDEADTNPGDGLCQTASATCSLRAAIEEANATAADSIHFDIAGSGPHVITPIADFPPITSPVVIDGSTQPGNEAVCTSAIPDRPAYSIVLDAGSFGAIADGLILDVGSDGSVIRGLNIRHFGEAAILMRGSGNLIQCNNLGLNEDGTSAAANAIGVALLGDASNNVVGTNGDGIDDAFEGNLISGNSRGGGISGGIVIGEGLLKTAASTAAAGNVIAGNYIGTDKSGTLALGNEAGVYVFFGASNNRIGTNADGTSDTLEGNLISGNSSQGVGLSSTTGNVVAGNLIGTDATGTNALGNETGVLLSLGVANRVGSDADGNLDEVERNTIAFNTSDGVFMAGDASSLGNTVQGNRFFENGGLGINLNGGTEDANGATANDTDDADIGPNNLQNTPVFLSAEAGNPGLQMYFLIDSATNNAAYPIRVEFFLADADSSEGQTFVISTRIFSQNAQQVLFVFYPTLNTVSPGDVLVATATDANGNTSEFSAPITVTGSGPSVDGIAVSLWLEGPWNGTEMDINLSEVLPETDPYFGTETVPPDFFTTDELGQEVVDWVWFELRSDESTVAYQAPGFLIGEGVAIGLFDDIEPGFYYIVVGHRNHLPVMSASPVECTEGECFYDFTTGQPQAYGTNPMIDLAGDGSGPFALLSGDADANGQVQASDKNAYFTPQVGLSGYHEADFDLNGEVQASDKNSYFTKNVGRGTQVPAASPPTPAAKTTTSSAPPLPATHRLLDKSE